MNVSTLLEHINKLTPLNHAFEDDSVGLVIGDENNKVVNLIVGHELEESLLDYCKNNSVDTVITYHPPPYKRIIDENEVETYFPDPITESFIDSSINIISIHTAQDVCVDGNAETLVELFGMSDVSIFANTNDNFGAGRKGIINKISPTNFKKDIENKLNTKIIRTNEYFNDIKEIQNIAILPGSGTQFIDEIIDSVDVFITGDISHRYLLKADEAKLGLVQVGHISTEIPGMKKFVKKLEKELNLNLNYIYRKYYE